MDEKPGRENSPKLSDSIFLQFEIGFQSTVTNKLFGLCIIKIVFRKCNVFRFYNRVGKIIRKGVKLVIHPKNWLFVLKIIQNRKRML